MAKDEDPLRLAALELEGRMRSYSAEQDSDDYGAQRVYLARLTSDFIQAVRATWIAYTRYPESKEWLQHRFTDDFLESSISIWALADQGVFNAGKREMRYMLEAAVKYVFVDQQAGAAELVSRLQVMDDRSIVPRSSVDPIDQLTFRMIPNPEEFAAAVHSAFGSLSGYTHMSRKQLEERFRRAEKREFSGFESANTLRAFNQVLAQTYDLILVLLMEGIGPSFAGDVFVQLLDPLTGWKFHKGRFVAQVSRSFDYKMERQHE